MLLHLNLIRFESLSHRIVSINLPNVNYIKKIYYLLYSSHCLIIICRIKCDFSSKFDFYFVNTYVYVYICACILCVCVLFFLNHFMCAVCLKRRTIAQIPFWKHYIIPSKYLVFVQLQWMLQSKKKDSDATHWNQTSRRHAICIQYMRATLLQTTSVPLIESLSKREPNWLPNNSALKKLQLTRYSLSHWLSQWEKML